MVVKRLKGGKDWQNLPGGLSGTQLGPKVFEQKGPRKNTAPLKRGKKQ